VKTAIGDAWIVNDPILGQGANIGSHCAWVAAQAPAAGPEPDADLGRRLEAEMWAFAGPVTALTNAFLQPPPPHVVELLEAATAQQAVADAFVAGFADPVRLAHLLGTPAAAATRQREAAGPVAA
jgi:2-polyprenyl-6-methoxyphenol hydroxylase-like FAD-dependent oxidoreductase